MITRRKPAIVGALVRPLQPDRSQLAFIQREVRGMMREKGLAGMTMDDTRSIAWRSAYVARWQPGEVGVVVKRFPRSDKYDVAVFFGAQCEWPKHDPEDAVEAALFGDPELGFDRTYYFTRNEIEVL